MSRTCVRRIRQGLAALIGSAVLLTAAAVPARAQSTPKSAMAEQAGWRALNSGDAEGAAAAFREALSVDPDNARMLFGAGAAAYVLKRDDESRQLLERALALDPGLARAREVLAHVHRRQGDLRGAIQALEAAVAALPDDAAARETLDRWRREADLHDRLQLAVGDHFTVSFDGPIVETLAEEALSSLERAFWRVSERLTAYPSRTIAVVLYSAEDFRDITRSPSWAAGAYDGIIRVPVRGALDNPHELDRVLAHEFTHALIHDLAGRAVPLWLNEGLATALEDDGALDWARGTIRSGRAPALATLPDTFEGLDAHDASVSYAVSALAAARLLDEAGGAAVANLLRDLGAGVPFQDAFLHRVQRPFAEFAAEMGGR
ncbi:MAG: tetratricopeptide repeat protein [Vicinamibacterales bacterium]